MDVLTQFYNFPSTQESRFVFVGSYAFLDAANLSPAQFLANIGGYAAAYSWGIVAPGSSPTVAAGGAGNLTGTYYYAVTFTSFYTNSESSPCAFTSGIALSSQQANLSGIPVSSDPQVNGVNIYRFGGTIGGTPLLVGSVANGTTTYTDNLADNAVTGQQLILRQDPVQYRL